MPNLTQEPPTHTNRLAGETSPYLLQHAHNPVAWYPWGPEALEKARAEEKPIFLSIGYSACHWCHVMERESFEDAETAALMNELFVNIKVDREERPDLDAIYMDAVQAMTGQGGWPMSVFLLPTGEPFYGGTYYPPEPRYGMPSFRQLLRSIDDAWRSRRDQVSGQAERLTSALQRSGAIGAHFGENSDLGDDILADAIQRMRQYFDEEEGGFGTQPKFPQPMTLDFALAQYKRTGDLDALFMVEQTLEKMAHGGIYDQLGGGFHRYSVDAIWLVPHFEKMLYDNAQLLRTYLHAWQVTGRPLFKRVVEQTIDYVLREMTAPTGGFYSTQDADSEGHEGKFFVWTPRDIEALLDAPTARIIEAYYGVTAGGNFEGKTILSVVRSAEEVAAQVGATPAQVEAALAVGRATLFAAREQRIKPARDEKVLAEWNGLMIHALAECGVALGRADALAAAVRAADFVFNTMSQPDGRLFRTWRAADDAGEGTQEGATAGHAHINGYLEDHAAMLRACLALYEATFDKRWLAQSSRLAQLLFSEFFDTVNGAFFQTGAQHESLVVRRKEFIDNAIPSGNALAAEGLLRLGIFVGNDDYRREATRICLAMKEAMAQQPTGFGRLLTVLSTLLASSREIVIVGEAEDAATQALLHEVRSRFLPFAVVAGMAPDEPTLSLPLLEGRTLVEGKPAAYVCENYACKLPVTTPQDLAALLDA
jgi:uncharacterized protein YyaL (SSP411 family)